MFMRFERALGLGFWSWWFLLGFWDGIGLMSRGLGIWELGIWEFGNLGIWEYGNMGIGELGMV
jgi:hypothetical protein